MKNYLIYFDGRAEYIADSEEEAVRMFENDHFGDYVMNISGVVEEEYEENKN